MAREVHLFTIDDSSEAVTSLREAEEYLSLHYDYLSLHYDEVRSEAVTAEPHEVGKLCLPQANRPGAYWSWAPSAIGAGKNVRWEAPQITCSARPHPVLVMQ